MKRKILVWLTVALLLPCFCGLMSASAAEAPPVLSAEQENLLNRLSELDNDRALDDAGRIEKIITLLFETKKDQLCDTASADVDFSAFWASAGANRENLDYFTRHVAAMKEYYAACGMVLKDGEITIDVKSLTVTGQTATVELYMWFSHVYCDNGVEMPFTSGYGRDYTVNLVCEDAKWRISDIDFYCEVTDVLRNPDIPISKYVETRYRAAHEVRPSEQITEIEPNGPVKPTMEYYSMNPSKCQSYATKYGGSNRSSYFLDYYGNDCQNFACQCIWYGLGGVEDKDLINSYSAPMVSESVSSSRAWHKDSDNWKLTDEFGDYVINGGSDKIGLVGVIYSGVANAEVGDILQLSNDYGASYFHSEVVVAATGSWGSRGHNNIYVSGHTDDVNGKRSDVVNDTEEDRPGRVFRTIHITGVWLSF